MTLDELEARVKELEKAVDRLVVAATSKIQNLAIYILTKPVDDGTLWTCAVWSKKGNIMSNGGFVKKSIYEANLVALYSAMTPLIQMTEAEEGLTVITKDQEVTDFVTMKWGTIPDEEAPYEIEEDVLRLMEQFDTIDSIRCDVKDSKFLQELEFKLEEMEKGKEECSL